jgi:CDP-diacylglycerol---glycerol-3-phosphate 3-phosphatidyltransferase
MTLPNKLTVSRLLLTIFFLAAANWHFHYNDTVALFLFAVASLTDYFDGEIARRRNMITNFGILMDPLADKILICSAFISFTGRGLMPAWMVAVIVARELAITGLRLLAAAQQKILAAEGFGKHKTVSQIVTIVAILVQQSYPEWGGSTEQVFQGWEPLLAEVAKWITVILTLSSGVLYLWRNRAIYQTDY